MELKNKKVVVVGLGTSGVDACLLLHEIGAEVYVTEENTASELRKNIRFIENVCIGKELGCHSEKFLHGTDLVVLSPGVSKGSLPVKYALFNGIPIISEIELGFSVCKGEIIAVTGTNGKSTVVTLLGEILKKAGKDVMVCGNIGNSFCGSISRIGKNTTVVLEVSSFQLEWIDKFRPNVSCILNITDDHIKRYENFKDYADTKCKIFLNQREDDIVVMNSDDLLLRGIEYPVKTKKLFYSMEEKVLGLYCDGDRVFNNTNGLPEFLFALPASRLRGRYNHENILAAALIALTRGVNPEHITQAVEGFQPLSHRVERIGVISGVEFIDDSKATNVDSTKRALEAMTKRVVLIAGGRDKGGDYSKIREEICKKVKKVLLIGESAVKIYNALKDVVDAEFVDSLEDAQRLAFDTADNGDIILLSPMCSSFDMFRDYKHRGEVFRSAFELIVEKTQGLEATKT